jgi:hypothetical protein
MKTVKMGRHSLMLIVIGVLFLVPLLSVSAASLPQSPFVKSEITNKDYVKVSGTEMVRNGSEVSIKVVLTNFSKEIAESELVFYSELKEAGGLISVDSSPWDVLQRDSSYTVEHKEVEEGVVISWKGTAPPEVGTQDLRTLLNITQKTAEAEYGVEAIREYVTSELIYNAVNAWHEANVAIEEANRTISNATEAGFDVQDAEANLELAHVRLADSLDHYNGGRPGESLEAANEAYNYSKEAINLVGVKTGAREVITLVVVAVIVVIVGAALVLWYIKWRKKKGIY